MGKKEQFLVFKEATVGAHLSSNGNWLQLWAASWLKALLPKQPYIPGKFNKVEVFTG